MALFIYQLQLLLRLCNQQIVSMHLVTVANLRLRLVQIQCMQVNHQAAATVVTIHHFHHMAMYLIQLLVLIHHVQLRFTASQQHHKAMLIVLAVRCGARIVVARSKCHSLSHRLDQLQFFLIQINVMDQCLLLFIVSQLRHSAIPTVQVVNCGAQIWLVNKRLHNVLIHQ